MAPENPLKCHLPGVCPAGSLLFCYKKRGGGAPSLGPFSTTSLNGAWADLLRPRLAVPRITQEHTSCLPAAWEYSVWAINPEVLVSGDCQLTYPPSPAAHESENLCVSVGKWYLVSFVCILRCSIVEVHDYFDCLRK